MRAPLALALSLTGILAGITAAGAADLPYPLAPRSVIIDEPAAPLVVYQYEPGVTMRAYWLPPWRDRHYFPHSNQRPRLGRRENLSAVRKPTRPPETYVRFWSNAAAFPKRAFNAAPARRSPPQRRYEPNQPTPATPNS
jgi:hypothetical protein